MTETMQVNLRKYEEVIKAEVDAGNIPLHAVVVCEVDRAFGKTYKANYQVNKVTLKNKHNDK